ncbi:MAG: hypothetical protein QOE52_4758 [Mycobacterium sp.]|jgi:hypothetical protein|nr:hypothetical protein [Mycobacterium sp.]
MPLPATLQNSHQNGGRIFLIFVADPRTVRLPARKCACSGIRAETRTHARPATWQRAPGHVRGTAQSEAECERNVFTRRRTDCVEILCLHGGLKRMPPTRDNVDAHATTQAGTDCRRPSRFSAYSRPFSGSPNTTPAMSASRAIRPPPPHVPSGISLANTQIRNGSRS